MSDNNITIKTTPDFNEAMVYFIPPVTTLYMKWGEAIMIFIFLAAIFITIIILYIYINLNQYQNRINVISNAALFGKDPQKMFTQFIKNTQAESIATAMNNIQTTKENLNTTTDRLDDKSTILSRQSGKDIPESKIKSTNLGISIQDSIAKIQDTISKIVGAITLQNYITDGAIKITKSPSPNPK